MKVLYLPISGLLLADKEKQVYTYGALYDFNTKTKTSWSLRVKASR